MIKIIKIIRMIKKINKYKIYGNINKLDYYNQIVKEYMVIL